MLATWVKTIYFRSFHVSVLLARFHFKFIRKSLYFRPRRPLFRTINTLMHEFSTVEISSGAVERNMLAYIFFFVQYSS